jgi:hypothetical protein
MNRLHAGQVSPSQPKLPQWFLWIVSDSAAAIQDQAVTGSAILRVRGSGGAAGADLATGAISVHER